MKKTTPLFFGIATNHTEQYINNVDNIILRNDRNANIY